MFNRLRSRYIGRIESSVHTFSSRRQNLIFPVFHARPSSDQSTNPQSFTVTHILEQSSLEAPQMPFILDRDSSVTLHSSGERTATYSLTLSDELRIGEVPHGGYVLVCLLTACAEYWLSASGNHPEPISVTGYYIAATTRATEGRIKVDEIKRGRYAVCRAVLSQPDATGKWTERTQCMATFGDMSKETGPTRLLDMKNPVPSRSICVADEKRVELLRRNAQDAKKANAVPNMRLMEEQLHDPSLPFPAPTTTDEVTGRAESRMWVRSRDDRPVDWKWLGGQLKAKRNEERAT